MVADHPDGLVRDQYLMEVADRCRLEAPPCATSSTTSSAAAPSRWPPARVRPAATGPSGRVVTTGRGRPTGRRSPAAANGAAAPRLPARDADAQRAGLEALRLLVHQPQTMAGRLVPLLFSDARQRAAFTTLSTEPDLHKAIHRAEDESPDVAVLLHRLAVEEPAADADDVVVQLVWIAARRALADLDSESRLSPDAFARLSQETTRLYADFEELKDPDGAIKAADRLVAWFIERGEENDE